MPKKKSDHKKSESLNWEDHKGLVWHIMAKRRSKIEWARVEPEEVAQRLELVVWWCLQPGKYDPKKGRVSTYVCTALLREIDRTIADLAGYPSDMKMRRECKATLRLDARTRDGDRSMHEQFGRHDPRLQSADDAEELSVLMHRVRLTKDQSMRVEMYLSGIMPMQMSRYEGVSRKAVSDSLTKARDAMRAEAELLV